MGCSVVWQKTRSRTKDARILMLGLDDSGKTTILHKLKLPKENIPCTIPTMGFNVESVTPVKNMSFTLWDVGGGKKMKPLHAYYFSGTEGLIFVVDSTDVSRMEKAKEELFWILHHHEMTPGCPVVVFANKQDLPDAQSTDKIIESLGLKELTKNPWRIQETCAVTGKGLYEGAEQMAEMLELNFKKQDLAEDRFTRSNFWIQLCSWHCFGSRTKKARILLRGLDASGKTTILYKLNRPNEKLLIIPTIGFNVETVTTVDNIFTMWDVGGGDKIKPLLVNYFPGTDGVMFSIDSTDVSRMEEAKEELFWILLHEEMTPGCPVVVFANKQDLPNAQSADKIIEGLGLKELTNNPWHLQETYAITGDGLYEGVEKMATMLKEFQEERS